MSLKFQSNTRKVSAADRMTLDQHLRFHKRLQPMFTLLDRAGWLITAVAIIATVPLFFLDRRSSSLWPFIGLVIYPIFAFSIISLESRWKSNIKDLAASNDIAAVAPLLDFADVTFLSLHSKSVKPKTSSEAMILPHLPALLTRMPAADGPTLTPIQRSALARLIDSPIYEKYFRTPGLREKIEAMVGR